MKHTNNCNDLNDKSVRERCVCPPDLKDYSCYKNFFQAVQLWQVVEMGNTCTICHGNNMMTECEACGWWGKCPPKGKEYEKKTI